MWACELKNSYFTKNMWKMSGDLRFHKSMNFEIHTYFFILSTNFISVYLIKLKLFLTYNSAEVLYCFIQSRCTNSCIIIEIRDGKSNYSSPDKKTNIPVITCSSRQVETHLYFYYFIPYSLKFL